MSCEMMNKAWEAGKADAEQGKAPENFENGTWYAIFYRRGYEGARLRVEVIEFARAESDYALMQSKLIGKLAPDMMMSVEATDMLRRKAKAYRQPVIEQILLAQPKGGSGES